MWKSAGASGFICSDWINKSTPITMKYFSCLKKDSYYAWKDCVSLFHFKTLSLLKHTELSYLALPTEVYLPSTQLHTHPQMPSEVLNIKKGPSPDQYGSVGWALLHKVKGHHFDSGQGICLSQGTCLSCKFGPFLGLIGEAANLCFSLTLMFLSLSFFLSFPCPLSLKRNK